MADSKDDAATLLMCAAECLDCGSVRLANEIFSRLQFDDLLQPIPRAHAERAARAIEHAASAAKKPVANTACIGHYLLMMIGLSAGLTDGERALMSKLGPGVTQWDGSSWDAHPDAPTVEKLAMLSYFYRK